MSGRALPAAFGRYRHTEGLAGNALLQLADVSPISRAFGPMVREQRWDASEMALATLLMARAAGSDLVLLPIVMAARAQTGALLRRADRRFGPEALAGKRVGVRAYGQTTGMWLRGALAEETGLRAEDVRWVTFEDAHVAGFRDPPWCERAPTGADLLGMLLEGVLDAAVFGNEVPARNDLATVYDDPEAAGASFRARHGFDPVNHLVVVRAAVARDEGVLRGLTEALLRDNPYPRGRAALGKAVGLGVEYCVAQGLLGRALTQDEVWAGLPARWAEP